MVLETVAVKKEEVLSLLVNEAKQNLIHFFDTLDLKSVQQVLDHLLQSQGTIFLTGVGKSGIIAKKVAATLSSSGTKAIYLSPMNALHGDIGMVSKGDSILLFSKSGESDELLHLCPTLRNKGAFLISVVSVSNSRLEKACDLTVILPIAKELCQFDMVPTTSTVTQLLFGDLLSVGLMRAKGFTLDEFMQNHPAGRLGKRLTFTVKDLMLKGEQVPLASPHDALITVLAEISGKKCGCLIVVGEDKKLLGIFTDGDLRRSLQKHGAQVLHKSVGELMSGNPKFVDSKMLAYDAMKYMEENQQRPITVLPVVDDGVVVGVLKMHDIIQSGI